MSRIPNIEVWLGVTRYITEGNVSLHCAQQGNSMDRHSMRTDSYARFHELLRLRGFSSYDEYLASDAWKQFNQYGLRNYRKAFKAALR